MAPLPSQTTAVKAWDSGPKNAPTLVFLHGYPDDSSTWSMQVEALQKNFHCICLDLPNFSETISKPQGYTFGEVVRELHSCLTQAELELTTPFHFVGHDWGAIYGYLFAAAYPAMVKSFTGIDVGAKLDPQRKIAGNFLLPAYQLLLATSFGLSCAGNRANGAASLLSGLVLKVLGKVGVEKNQPRLATPKRRSPFSNALNYPYYYFWRSMLPGGEKIRLKTPAVPVFFCYGTRGIKTLMDFHSETWTHALLQNPANKVECFEHSGHWLMRDEPERFNRSLVDFLETVPA